MAGYSRFNMWAGISEFQSLYTAGTNPPVQINGSVIAVPGRSSLLRAYNPSIILTLYYHSCLFDPVNDFSTYNSANPWKNSVINGSINQRAMDWRWILCNQGTTIATTALTSNATSVTLAAASNFVNGGYAVITTSSFTNPELVLVTAGAGTTTLTITRNAQSVFGTYSAQAYAVGSIIRPCVSTLGANGLPAWNVTTNCPAYAPPDTYGFTDPWNKWITRFTTEKLMCDGGAWTSQAQGQLTDLNGLFFDNWVDQPGQMLTGSTWSTVADINGTNTATGLSNAVWLAGMQDLATKLRNQIPAGLVLTANTGGTAANFGDWLNGGMAEGIDQTGTNGLIGNAAAIQTHMNNWISNGVAPQLYIYNGSSNRGGLTSVGAPGTANSVGNDYQAMRLNLALCLQSSSTSTTAGAFFCYDEMAYTGSGGGGHQTGWWYDEYAVNINTNQPDGKSTGWLGKATGATSTPSASCYMRYFDNGVALANASASPFAFSTTGNFHRIDATGASGQAPSINSGGASGSSFTVPAGDGLILIRG